jgi:hypothetical protein
LRTPRRSPSSRHGGARPDFEDGGPNPSAGQRWRRCAIECGGDGAEAGGERVDAAEGRGSMHRRARSRWIAGGERGGGGLRGRGGGD